MVCGLHWHWLHDPTIDAGIVQAAGSVLSAVIAAGAAFVALGAWRSQELGRRAIQYAEDAMTSADDVLAFVGEARNRFTTVSLENTERSQERIGRLVIQGQVDAVHRARNAVFRCRGFLRRLDLVTGKPSAGLADALDAPVRRLAQTHLLVQYLSDPPPEDTDQRSALAAAKSDFLGLPRPTSRIPVGDWLTYEDTIQKDLSEAHRGLERVLRPILLGRVPKTKGSWNWRMLLQNE